jgi:protocatechuate 3,4-dioxygenase beta subunit
MRSLVVLLLLLGTTASLPSQTSSPSIQTKQDHNAELCRLEGVVLADPGDKPLRKAAIHLGSVSEADNLGFGTITDTEGRFVIEKIRPGEYRARVERTGFVDARHNFQGRRLKFEAGQEIRDLVWHLVPAAAILGRVTDEDGDPIRGVIAGIMRGYADPEKLHGVFGMESMAITNDQGLFRIDGLQPGRYYVAVQPRSQIGLASTEHLSRDQNEMDYVTTYYPGTPDPNQAATLELRPGDETPVKITLQKGPTFAIRGRIAPFADASSSGLVRLVGKNRGIWLEVPVGKDWGFELRGIPAGPYLVTLDTAGDAPQYAMQPVQVTDRDVNNVFIGHAIVANIHGKIRAETNPKPDLSQFFVALGDASSENDFFHDELVLRSRGAEVAKDGTFVLSGVMPGSYYIELSSKLPGNYFVKSIAADTRDVTDAPLKVGGGEHVSVDLVISLNSTSIDGVVVDAKDKPVADVTVAAIPEAKYRQRQERYQGTQTDQNGHFRFSGLHPGEYTLMAWEDLGFDSYLDPVVVAKYEASGKIVRLSQDSHEGLKLRVIPAPVE